MGWKRVAVKAMDRTAIKARGQTRRFQTFAGWVWGDPPTGGGVGRPSFFSPKT